MFRFVSFFFSNSVRTSYNNRLCDIVCAVVRGATLIAFECLCEWVCILIIRWLKARICLRWVNAHAHKHTHTHLNIIIIVITSSNDAHAIRFRYWTDTFAAATNTCCIYTQNIEYTRVRTRAHKYTRTSSRCHSINKAKTKTNVFIVRSTFSFTFATLLLTLSSWRNFLILSLALFFCFFIIMKCSPKKTNSALNSTEKQKRI